MAEPFLRLSQREGPGAFYDMTTIPQEEPYEPRKHGRDHAYLEHLQALEEQKQKRELLSTQDIATELEVTPQKVGTWIREGKHGIKLKGVMLAGRYEVSRYDLNRFLERTADEP